MCGPSSAAEKRLKKESSATAAESAPPTRAEKQRDNQEDKHAESKIDHALPELTPGQKRRASDHGEEMKEEDMDEEVKGAAAAKRRKIEADTKER